MKFGSFLLPDYVLNFKCECCTKCCRQWKIKLDTATGEEWSCLAENDREIASVMRNNINEDDRGRTFIKMVGDGVGNKVCPLLDEDGLCGIQKRYGEEMLPDSCRSYPRKIFYTERGCEMALSYACPVAARFLKYRHSAEFYRNPPGFDFPEIHEEFVLVGFAGEREGKEKEEYFEVEELLLDIMRDRTLNIENRIILTGIAVKELKNKDAAWVRELLNSRKYELLAGSDPEYFRPEVRLKLIKDAVDRLVKRGVSENDASMRDYLQIAYDELYLLDADPVPDKIKLFNEMLEKYCNSHIDSVAHIYENYFVNYIFSKMYYFFSNREAFLLKVFFYQLISFLAVCACAWSQKPVNEEILVDVVSTVDRSVGHSIKLYRDILNKFR